MAFGSGVGPAGLAGPGEGSQPLANIRVGAGVDGTRLPEFAGFSSPLGTPVVQRTPGQVGCRYLSVREVAAVLGVSRATIYRQVEEGRMSHVRVSSTIRIPAEALPAAGGRSLATGARRRVPSGT